MRQAAAGLVLGFVVALAAGAGALAQEQKPSTIDKVGKAAGDVGEAAGKLVTKPVEDVGVSKKEIPPLLVEASRDPYSLAGVSTCQQLSAAVTELNGVLGPDYRPGQGKDEDKTKALASAGGNAALSAVIPFRGVIREVSGAAPAQRAYNAAVDAGVARRGFLRGVHQTRNCKTGF